jgi:serralysin
MDEIRASRVCVDRPLSIPDLERASDIAVDMRPDNRHELEGIEGVELPRPAMARMRGKQHPVGAKLKVGFLDGDRETQDRVFEVAQEWSKYGNLDYVRAEPRDADVRISFRTGEGSWSNVGADIYSIRYPNPTMVLGWINRSTPKVELWRTGLHEFGHTNSYVHEHQSPGAGGLEWLIDPRTGEEYAYAFYGGPPNSWSHDETFQQVIEKYSVTQTQFTAFDAVSIMLYPVGPPLVKFRVEGGNVLSLMDKQFHAASYPGRDGVVVVPPPPPVPVSDLPVVEVGAPGLRAVIPGGPKPARLLLHKAKADDFVINVIVRGTGGHAPIVTLAKSDGDGTKQMKLAKDKDGAYVTEPKVGRPAGDYLLSIYHPLAGHGGFCWVEARHA